MLLTTLAVLKSHLMPGAAASRTEKDSQLTLIGLGVAAKFENYIGRDLPYKENDTFSKQASDISYCLPRFPILGDVTATLQTTPGSAGDDISTNILTVDKDCGLVGFGRYSPGSADQRVILTYSGGYWIDGVSEGSAPEGVTPLPDDLALAFVEQCRAVCDAQGLFQTGAMGDPAKQVIAREIALLPDVKEILNQYRRFA